MKIAITRPEERAEETVKAVQKKGWEAMIVPTIEIRKREALNLDLEDYDWLVLTSAFGAEIAYECFGDALKEIKIACIGPKTKEVLRDKGIDVELMPLEYKSEALAEALVKEGIRGKRILAARASAGRKALVERLKEEASITEVALYDTRLPGDRSKIDAFSKALAKGEIDAVIFTSSQGVRNLFRVIREEGFENLKRVKVCAIGPITAQTLKELRVRVDAVPKEYTVKACLDVLEGLL